MVRKSTIAGELARDAIEQFPSYPTRTLAALLRKKHPAVFPNENQARSRVQAYRGEKADNRHKTVAQRRSKRTKATCMRWGANIPMPDKTDWGWRELPDNVNKWLILADIHAPYHDDDAVHAALDHAQGKVDGILLLGDFLDHYQLSSFMRDPRKRSYESEIEQAKQFLDSLLATGVKSIVYKGGNHELRLERYLMQRAPDLWPMLAEGFSLPKLLDLEGRCIQWIRPQDPIRHHQLAILHGHEWGNRFANPVNAARGAFLKATECVLEGHCHRKSNHSETSLFGRPIQCWSVGCLCDLHPEYYPLGNKWAQGFAYLTTGSEWAVENHQIIGGKVLS